MRRLLLPLAAAAALALPAGALAWGGDHHGDFHGMFAAVSGTGTSFGGATASATGSIVAGNDHPNGHFNADFRDANASGTVSDGMTNFTPSQSVFAQIFSAKEVDVTITRP